LGGIRPRWRPRTRQGCRVIEERGLVDQPKPLGSPVDGWQRHQRTGAPLREHDRSTRQPDAPPCSSVRGPAVSPRCGKPPTPVPGIGGPVRHDLSGYHDAGAFPAYRPLPTARTSGKPSRDCQPWGNKLNAQTDGAKPGSAGSVKCYPRLPSLISMLK
jgi:hypothetical protein